MKEDRQRNRQRGLEMSDVWELKKKARFPQEQWMTLEPLEQRKKKTPWRHWGIQDGAWWQTLRSGSLNWTKREKRAWRGERKEFRAGGSLLSRGPFNQRLWAQDAHADITLQGTRKSYGIKLASFLFHRFALSLLSHWKDLSKCWALVTSAQLSNIEGLCLLQMKPFAGNPHAHTVMLFVSLLESFIWDGEIFPCRGVTSSLLLLSFWGRDCIKNFLSIPKLGPLTEESNHAAELCFIFWDLT